MIDERLTFVALRIAGDIATQVDGADVAAVGFSLTDTDSLQINVQPMDQNDEPEDRDGEAYRRYSLWVVTRQKINHTDVDALVVATNLVLRIAKRYPINGDLNDLEPPITDLAGMVLYEKPFFPLYLQHELDTTDFFHSVLVLNFYERTT